MHLKKIQKLMQDLYYQKDKDRGVAKTMLWFVEETGELSESLRKYLSLKNVKNEKNIKTQIGEEMADILAWLCSLANLLEIDLEKALEKKYPMYCRKCGKNPCECTHV